MAVAIILLAALWRHCVKRYMPDAPFMFFLLGFLALFFGSCLFELTKGGAFYTTVQAAGLMFALAGIYLLLKSVEKENTGRLKLFFACLCLALVVGCRPNMIFVSLLVPVALWKRRSWKLLPFVAIPYIMVAVPICWYNYVRYDSVFEFGQKYCLAWVNIDAYGLLNPLGKAVKLFSSSVCYLFAPVVWSLRFPFVDGAASPGFVVNVFGIVQQNRSACGMIGFPVVFCLFYLFRISRAKDKPETFFMLPASLLAAAMIMVCISELGFTGGYMTDMAFLIILPSLFCAYYWVAGWGRGAIKDEGGLPVKVREKIVYILFAVTILTGLLFYGGYSNFGQNDPVLFRYMERSLGIIRKI
jgi:hypothetical protein